MSPGKVLFLTVNFLLTYILVTVQGVTFDLDSLHEAGKRWKIKDNMEYFELGSELRSSQISNSFPPKFKFGHFDNTVGIWALVPVQRHCETPEMESNESIEQSDAQFIFEFFKEKNELSETEDTNDKPSSTAPATKSMTTKSSTETSTVTPVCYGPSNATFQFKVKSQVMDSISITYCLGGNAELHLEQGTQDPQQINAEGEFSDKWSDASFSATGGIMQLVAYVHEKGDYILIDRITVKTREPKPTTKRPPTEAPTEAPTRPTPTPTSPEPKPSSSTSASSTTSDEPQPSSTLKPTETPTTSVPSPVSGEPRSLSLPTTPFILISILISYFF